MCGGGSLLVLDTTVRGHLFGRAFAQMVLTALTIAVSK